MEIGNHEPVIASVRNYIEHALHVGAVVMILTLSGCGAAQHGPRYLDIAVTNVGTDTIGTCTIRFGDKMVATTGHVASPYTSTLMEVPVPDSGQVTVLFNGEGGGQEEAHFTVRPPTSIDVYALRLEFLISIDQKSVELKARKRVARDSDWEDFEIEVGEEH